MNQSELFPKPPNMIEQLDQNTEQDNDRMLSRIAVIGAIATLGGSLVGPSATVESAEAAPAKLRGLTELPGYKRHITPETKQKINDSTVVIMSRYKGSSDDWQKVCTATAVKMTGQRPTDHLFLTAGHCIEVGDQTGAFRISGNKVGSANYINAQPKEFAIADINANEEMQKLAPMGFVTGISVNTSGVDMALLRAESSGDIPQTGKRLSELKPIQFKKPKLVPGEQVAMFTSPEGSLAPIKTVGRYLGTVSHRDYDNGPIRKFALVGISPKTQAKDACLPGASGSSAVTRNGSVIGPLSVSVNFGYKTRPKVPSPTFAREGGYLARNLWARSLRTKLNSYSTLCAYSVPPANIESTMLAGFNQPAEKFTHSS